MLFFLKVCKYPSTKYKNTGVKALAFHAANSSSVPSSVFYPTSIANISVKQSQKELLAPLDTAQLKRHQASFSELPVSASHYSLKRHLHPPQQGRERCLQKQLHQAVHADLEGPTELRHKDVSILRKLCMQESLIQEEDALPTLTFTVP